MIMIILWQHHRSTAARLLGLSLLKCHWTVEGDLLDRPYKVSPARWGKNRHGRSYYEVHHRKGPYNHDPRALAVLPRALHDLVTNHGFDLPTPRGGWGQ